MLINRFRKYFAILGSLAAVSVGISKEATSAIQVPIVSSLQFEGVTKSADGSIALKGKGTRKQLIVTGTIANKPTDVTRKVAYKISPAGLVKVDTNGVIQPIKDGKATLTAEYAGTSTSLVIQVENAAEERPIHFVNQITPIFTKLGCNGGGCHGKSGGQNGFRLSLLGFEPLDDYEYLVKESQGRRLFATAPDQSLLLQKAVGSLPHGGGKRLEKDSEDYRLLRRWMMQGMPLGDPKAATVERIEVFPKERTFSLLGQQQLLVLAHYTDGSTEDVTANAIYEANDKELAKAEPSGTVSVMEHPGDVAVMVRYQSQVAVFRGTIPKGAPVDHLPPAKNFIDELVFKRLKEVGMPPSDICDDATFIRRVTLDVAGRIPTAQETRNFVQEADPKKRDALIDRLLASSDYADYFANKWSALLRNRRDNGNQIRGNYAFHSWIRESLDSNKPYDQFVRDILAASGEIGDNPAVAWYRQVKESKNQLEDTAQLFLGTRLQCAQCHHHPYEKWSQQDYFSFAAFFSRVGRKPGEQPGEEIVFHRRGAAQAMNTKTKANVTAAGLGATPAKLAPDDDPRHALVDWMSSENNPFFSKALVNRYWKHFFNRGLVDPEDDMRATNPAVNPELLEALAAHFVTSKFDFKSLVRTICQSTVYQLSSTPNEHNALDKHYFSRFYPRRLTAEVLLDSIDHITLSPTAYPGLPAGTRAVQLPDNSFNSQLYFLSVFGRPDASSSCECERSQDASLAQSLHLLNSKEIQAKLTGDKGRAAQLAADARSEEEKFQELYWAALSRPANSNELALAQSYIENSVKAKPADQAVQAKRQAYEDLVWVMMSTKEFLFNR